MKHLKKSAGLLLAVVMMFAMCVTASAANIIIDGAGEGAQYEAYKLLSATDLGNTKFTYTVEDKYRGILKTVTGKTDDTEIINYIKDSNPRVFADTIYKEIRNGRLTADATTSSGEFKNIANGYYLIAETGLGSSEKTYSLVMLDTAGNDECRVTPKKDEPTLEKKVKEKNDSTGNETAWQDGADYDLGDSVPFKLTGTVSRKYDSYNSYYYAFHDKMSAGLTFNKDSVIVKVDGTRVTGGYKVVTDNNTDNCTFEVEFADLKKITGAKVKFDSVITVEYNARLNEGSVIGSVGNPNEAKLEYSNNPYFDGSGKPSTSETPEDKVIVFTYKLVANKVNGENEPLAGAGFTLYKYNNETKDYEPVGSEIKGTDESPKYSFEFNRLDAGKYKLVETTVPSGYNKAEDLEFFVEATYDDNAADPKFKTLVIKAADGQTVISGENTVFSIDSTAGSATTDVVNKSGSLLPSTGGIGTTIFYVVGVVLMLGAGVLLITKRRMSAKH